MNIDFNSIRGLARIVLLAAALAGPSSCKPAEREQKTPRPPRPFGTATVAIPTHPVRALAPAFPPGDVPTNAIDRPLRLASYNVERFFDGIGDGAARTPRVAAEHGALVAEIVGEIDPDILFLQEVENAAALIILNQSFQPPYPLGYVTRLIGNDGKAVDINLAILSRVPLDNASEVIFAALKDPDKPTRGLLRVEASLAGGHRLLAYNVHLKSNYGDADKNQTKRKRALELLREDAQRVVSADTNAVWEVLVVGDTNVDPEQKQFANDPSLSPLSDWVDVWTVTPGGAQVTVPRRLGDRYREFPSACFDRLFVAPALDESPWTVTGLSVVARGTDTNNVNAFAPVNRHISDHYPIYWDLIP